MRRETKMQRKRISLVFQQYSGAQPCDSREPALQFLVQRRSMGSDCFTVSLQAHFRTVAANGGKLIRRKNQIDIIERTAADQCQRAVGSLMQAMECLGEPWRHPD